VNNITHKIKLILKSEKYLEVLKFTMVGILNTLVDISVSFILNGFFGIAPVICHVVGYSCGTLNSFFLNKFYTFKSSGNTQKSFLQFARFIIINLISLSVTSMALKLLMEVLLIDFYFSKVLVTFLSLSLNFVGSKFWVFRNR
jgi:putative flippase GtrA